MHSDAWEVDAHRGGYLQNLASGDRGKLERLFTRHRTVLWRRQHESFLALFFHVLHGEVAAVHGTA
jgi:hypothetical protein